MIQKKKEKSGYKRIFLRLWVHLATIKNCDRAFILESGSLVNQGKFSDISKSESYKKISGELM